MCAERRDRFRAACALGAWLLAAPAGRGAPVFECAPAEVDAGSLTGTVARAVFLIRNGGDEPLAITRVRNCCGSKCSLTPTNLPPAGTVEASIVVDLKGRSGVWLKTTYLFTNDPAKPIVALRVKGRKEGPGNRDDFERDAWDKQLAAGTPRPAGSERSRTP
jgi:hypothetical protein